MAAGNNLVWLAALLLCLSWIAFGLYVTYGNSGGIRLSRQRNNDRLLVDRWRHEGDNVLTSCMARDAQNYMPTEDVPRWREGDQIKERESDASQKTHKTLIVHTYHEGHLFCGYEILFDAYLVTQDLDRTRLIHWMAEDWRNSTDPYKLWIVERYAGLPNIEFRMLDHFALAQGTCFAERPEFLYRNSIEKYGLRDWSNVVRWLLLFHYGGVWIDSDSIPLMDFTILHNANPQSVVAGYAADPKKPHDKEGGMFNNNFLSLTYPRMRKKILEVACEFRRMPLGTFDRKGRAEFENVIPVTGSDSHTMRVMNHWLFNDGTLRRCFMRDDCDIHIIGLGETDPGWLRTNDMYSMCERVRNPMGGYAHDFQQLLASKAWTSSTDYLNNSDWKSHVWVVHTRASHCRSKETSPVGLLKWFHSAILERMSNDPFKAPRRPVDFMSFDKYEVKKDDHLVEFYHFIIAVVSDPSDIQKRQNMRGLINNPGWFNDLGSAMSDSHKLLFIVPYIEGSAGKHQNPRLIAELHRFQDLILVDPSLTSRPESHVSSEVRRGLLKILNHFDAHYFLLLFNPDVFVNIPNLYALTNLASGNSLFEKETPVKPFIVTHKTSNAAAEDDLYARYNLTAYSRHRGQHFILFSRNNLPSLLGIPLPPEPPSKNKKGKAAQTAVATEEVLQVVQPLPDEDFDPSGVQEYVFTLPLRTVKTAVQRMADRKGPLAVVADDVKFSSPSIARRVSAEKGLLATVPLDYQFEALSYRTVYLSLKNRVSSQHGQLLMSQFSRECAVPSGAGENQNQGEPVQDDSPLLPVNATFIWGVPCRVAMWELFLASTTVPKSALATKFSG